MTDIVIDIDVRPQSPNRLHREHYSSRASRRRRERDATLRALTGHTKPTPPVVVTLVRVGPLLTDDDNVAYSMKTIRDAIGEWLGTGDSPRAPVRWRYAQAKARIPARILDRGRVRNGFRIWCQVKIVEVRRGNEG